jgi:hypothetical protein
MKIGGTVLFCGNERSPVKTTILDKGLPSGIEGDDLVCYLVQTPLGQFLFYIKNELNTHRHYNPGNRAFWIEPLNGNYGFPAP